MKAVIQTQIRENYGAHDWDGVGECPQGWKFKGGNTYVLNVSIEENMSRDWWALVEAAITERSDRWEEYIIGETVVDDIDYVESDHVEEWDAPINLTLSEGRFLAVRRSSDVPNNIASKIEQWVQVSGRQTEFVLMYEMKDGRVLTYQEYCEEHQQVLC